MLRITQSGLVAFAALALVFTFAIGSATSSDLSPTPSPLPVPSPTATYVPVTVVPEQTDTYFVLENNEILYRNSPTNETPCRYFISGTVMGLGEIPFLSYVVNIKTVESDGETEVRQNYGGDDPENAPSGWVMRFPDRPATYEIWLTHGESGEDITPHIVVSMQDCDQNRAIVNFVQVKLLPGQLPPDSPFIATVMPSNTDAPFVVENNKISYRYSKTFGKPCYYIMSGRVLDPDGKPYTDFIVNIKSVPIEDVIQEEGYALPNSDSSEWSSVLPQSPDIYEIWLTTEIGGQEISPHVFVPPRNCDQNWAIINFVQVKPIP